MARAMNRRLDLKSRQYQHTLLSGKSAVKERSISLRKLKNIAPAVARSSQSLHNKTKTVPVAARNAKSLHKVRNIGPVVALSSKSLRKYRSIAPAEPEKQNNCTSLSWTAKS